MKKEKKEIGFDKIAIAYSASVCDVKKAMEECNIKIFKSKDDLFNWLFRSSIEDYDYYLDVTHDLTEKELMGRTVKDTILEEDERIKFIDESTVVFWYM